MTDKKGRLASRLIVNADGYGFTPGVNAGIEQTLPAGVVRSMSCTPNFGYLEPLPDLVRSYPDVSVGVHYNLSVGRPISDPSQVPTLVDENGDFVGAQQFKARALSGRLRAHEIARELRQQTVAVSAGGVALTHWDGHQNLHLYPGFFPVAAAVAAEYGIERMRTHRRRFFDENGQVGKRDVLRYYSTNPLRAVTHGAAHLRMGQVSKRFRMADGLVTPGYIGVTHKTLPSFWEGLADTLPGGTFEIYCHPAVPDNLLRQHAYYVDQRETEAAVLSSVSLRQALEAGGVELISFYQL